MKQICIIHGGTTFATDADYHDWLGSLELQYERLLPHADWKPWLAESLPDADVLLPSMPSKTNAKYQEWTTYFKKVLPFLNADATLIGHSLGGIFLAKYLQENHTTLRYHRLVLIAAPYDDEASESLGDFRLTSARDLENVADYIDIFHSDDDPVVPFDEAVKYQADLPTATVHRLTGYGHFNQSTFPELLEILDK